MLASPLTIDIQGKVFYIFVIISENNLAGKVNWGVLEYVAQSACLEPISFKCTVCLENMRYFRKEHMVLSGCEQCEVLTSKKVPDPQLADGRLYES